MSKQPHILFISSWYPNRNNPTHGIFNTVFAKAASLHNAVSVLHVCSDDTLTQDFELVESNDNNIYTCIVYYKKVNNKMPGLSQLKKRNKLWMGFDLGFEQIKNKIGIPNLIQLNVAMPAGMGVLHLSEKYNIPYVVNEGWSGYYSEDGNYKGFFLKHFTKKIIKNARVIMPVSEGLKTAMLSHDLKGNYVVVPNAIDETRFKPVSVSKGTTTKFLHISSLNDREKNISGIIRAFSSAYKTNQDLELNIVGDSDEISVFKHLVTSLGLNKVIHFKGTLMGDDLVNEINANDALLVFSNYETFGITVIEALACGKPVITALSGGVGNLITSELGYTIERRDEKALSEKILLLAKNKDKFNPDILRQFVTDRFTVTKVGEQLRNIYNTVLSQPAK
jgi:glycosyltransferase involved in cell wall biosynthesis